MVPRIVDRCFHMRNLFDRGMVSRIPFTRMRGVVQVSMSPDCRRHPNAGWAIAAALALLVCAIPGSTGTAMAQKHESRHEIDQLEDEFRDALITSNTKVMASLLANDYVGITPWGTLQSRDETLQGMRSEQVRFTLLNITDRKVRFYGTTAVVTSLADVQAVTPEGKLTGSYRYTRVYVRDAQGTFKIVSFEASRVREPGPHIKNDFH